MQFTYKIENYYPYENRVFVIYTPTDTAFETLGGWVQVTADMTAEQISARVIDSAPLDKWAMVKSASIQTLIGTEATGTKVAPVVVEETVAAKTIRLLTQAETRIKAERDVRKNGGTLVSGKWFHSDSDSRIQQLGLLMMGASIPAVQWKTLDGSFVTMSQTLAGGIFQATAALDMTLFATCESHIEAVRLVADPSTYNYSTGWPARYEGTI